MNTFTPIDPKLIDQFRPEHDGYPDKLAAQDTVDVLKDVCGSASQDFPDWMWIDEKDWGDKAAENDKYGTWGKNYVDRFTNQTPTHECTCHMLRTEFEGCRNRQRAISYPKGPQAGFRYEESKLGSVWVSPLSIYAEANPRQWGGASCWQVLEIAMKRGFLPETVQPSEYGFKHAIPGTTGKGGINQASGRWLSVPQFPDGWRETAAWLMPQEIIFTRDWRQATCMLLHGRILGYGRKGHAVPPWYYNHASRAYGYCDSYDVERWDSLATFKAAVAQGVHCIESVKAPDNWLNPAGTLAT